MFQGRKLFDYVELIPYTVLHIIYSMYDMCSDEYAGMEVGYVESVVFVQDIKNNTWVTCEDETYKTEDLEKIACGIVLYHFDACLFLQ